MSADHIRPDTLEEPLAKLERELISAYLAGAGKDLATLVGRTDAQAQALLLAAAQYASQRLSEVEARAHYVRSLHGEA